MQQLGKRVHRADPASLKVGIDLEQRSPYEPRVVGAVAPPIVLGLRWLEIRPREPPRPRVALPARLHVRAPKERHDAARLCAPLLLHTLLHLAQRALYLALGGAARIPRAPNFARLASEPSVAAGIAREARRVRVEQRVLPPHDR